MRPVRSLLLLCLLATPAAAQVAAPNNPVVLWKETKHSSTVTRVAFAPEYAPRPANWAKGPHLVSTADDGQVLAWDVKSKAVAQVDKLKEPVWSVAVHPTRPVVYYGNHFTWGSVVRSADLGTRLRPAVVRGTGCANHLNINAVDFGPDGDVFALCASAPGVKVFATDAPGVPPAALPTGDVPLDVGFAHPAAKAGPRAAPKAAARFAYGCKDGTVETAEATVVAKKGVPTGVQVKAAGPAAFPKHSGPVTRVRFSADNALLGTSGADGTVILSDAATGKEVRRIAAGGGRVNGLAFDPLGTFLATAAEDGTVAVWDVATGTKLSQLPPHAQAATWVAVSPDGAYVASGGRDFAVHVSQVRVPKK